MAKKLTTPTIPAKKLFLKITAAEAPLVFLRGRVPACVDVSEWLLHVCIEAEDHGIDGHASPATILSVRELGTVVADLDETDLIIAIPEDGKLDPAPYAKLAREHGRDVIVVDVGTAGPPLPGYDHVAVTEAITDEDWYAVAAEIERAAVAF